MRYAPLFALIFAGSISAHDVTVKECPFYSEIARAIINQRNAGVSTTELVPKIMRFLSACGAKCPVTDADDTKRILNFVRDVYSLDVPEGKEIDADASSLEILNQCVKQAEMSRPNTITPDPSVPSTGPQIES